MNFFIMEEEKDISFLLFLVDLIDVVYSLGL